MRSHGRSYSDIATKKYEAEYLKKINLVCLNRVTWAFVSGHSPTKTFDKSEFLYNEKKNVVDYTEDRFTAIATNVQQAVL